MQRLAILTAVLALALPAAPAMAATDTVDLLTEADAELDGAADDDYAGKAVAALGDVNGDGLPDLAVAAGNGELSDPSLLSPDTAAGRIYVVFGRLTPLLDLSTLASGFGIVGETPGAPLGNSVAGAGDVNGDGLDDIIVGAEEVSPLGRAGAGSAYVIFGKATARAVEVASLGSAGFRIDGADAGDAAGTSVAAAGDVNGDGLDDVLVGAPGVETSGFDAGTAYVVFGRTDRTPVDLDALGSGGYRMEGGNLDGLRAGTAVAGAGDVNGDGRPDALVGAPGDFPSPGQAYVVFGKANTIPVPLDALGSSGYPIEGAADGDRLGASLANLGDVSGDGRPDVLVGAPDGGASYDGAAYVVFGKATTPPITVAASFASGGYAIEGPGSGGRLGAVSAALGDVNGDGVPDAGLGDQFASLGGRSQQGAVFVVFGKRTTATLRTSALTSSQGFRIDGPTSNARVGAGVAGPGDVIGSGRADVLAGGYRIETNGRRFSGAAFAVDRPPLRAIIGGIQLDRDVITVATDATALVRTLQGGRRVAAGAEIRYDLRQAAKVRLTMVRLLPGRRTRTGCAPASGAVPPRRRCLRPVAAATFVRNHRAGGAKSFAFSGRAGTRALPPGRYLVAVTARNAAGRQWGPELLGFRIVPG